MRLYKYIYKTKKQFQFSICRCILWMPYQSLEKKTIGNRVKSVGLVKIQNKKQFLFSIWLIDINQGWKVHQRLLQNRIHSVNRPCRQGHHNHEHQHQYRYHHKRHQNHGQEYQRIHQKLGWNWIQYMRPVPTQSPELFSIKWRILNPN